MDDEKMAILKMLEEGKITSEEALLLLEALEGEHKQSQQKDQEKEDDEEDGDENEIKYRIDDEIKKWKNLKWKSRDNDFEDKMEQLSKLGEKMGKLGEDLGKLGEDLGEKMGLLGESIGEKAASFAEKFVEKFFNSSFGRPNGQELSAVKTWNNIPDGLNIDVNGINGKIEFNVYDGEEMKVELKWGIKPGSKVNVKVDQNVDSLPGLKIVNSLNSMDKPYFSIGYDADIVNFLTVILWLPAKNYNRINLNTSNGKIYISRLACSGVEAKSSNGKIEILNSSSKELRCITSNAKVLLENVYADSVFVKTSNGKVESLNSELGDISFITSNSSISIDHLRIIESPNRKIELITSNGSINFGFNEIDSAAYDIILSTSNGHVNVHLKVADHLTDVKHITKNNFKYKSENYGQAPVNLAFKFLTSNGSINIYGED